MFCPNCGSENPDNCNFCRNCGSTFNNASQYQQFNNANYGTSSINAEGILPTEAYKFRAFAREKLRGRWGTAAVLMLVYTLCVFGISFVSALIPLIGNIAFFAISPVLTFGLLVLWIKFKNGENINYLDFFNIGFSNFGKVWLVTLRVFLKLLAPIIIVTIVPMILLIIVPILGRDFGVISIALMILTFISMIIGFILLIPRSYKYMFATNELAYSLNDTPKAIVERSGEFMMGKRVGAFWLSLTFIGWSFLGGLGCYIPFLWITPYMSIANIIYYEWASNRLR